jgi:hypothetical protein
VWEIHGAFYFRGMKERAFLCASNNGAKKITHISINEMKKMRKRPSLLMEQKKNIVRLFGEDVLGNDKKKKKNENLVEDLKN